MPRASNGVYTLPSTVNPVVTDTTISSDWANTTLSDIASVLTSCLDRAGRGAMQANLAMGGFKVTGAADATASGDLATKGQMDAAIAAATGLVPVGGIVMWSGTVATIPANWQLCDGTNGTPDLRDKFVIGAKQDDAGAAKTNVTGALTQSGGTKDAIAVDHTHTGTTSTAADHTHTENRVTSVGTTTYAASAGGTTFVVAVNSGSAASGAAGSHNHTFTTAASGSSGTNANLPPYYALAFIQRIA